MPLMRGFQIWSKKCNASSQNMMDISKVSTASKLPKTATRRPEKNLANLNHSD